MATLETVLSQALKLTTREKLKLIWYVSLSLLPEGRREEALPEPSGSLWGALSDLGSAPSRGDIAEVRAAMWAGLPGDDI